MKPLQIHKWKYGRSYAASAVEEFFTEKGKTVYDQVKDHFDILAKFDMEYKKYVLMPLLLECAENIKFEIKDHVVKYNKKTDSWESTYNVELSYDSEMRLAWTGQKEDRGIMISDIEKSFMQSKFSKTVYYKPEWFYSVSEYQMILTEGKDFVDAYKMRFN